MILDIVPSYDEVAGASARTAAAAADGYCERAVLNAQCADIDAFIAMVKEVYTGEIIVGDIGAVIGTHAGQGTIGIVFLLSA